MQSYPYRLSPILSALTAGIGGLGLWFAARLARGQWQDGDAGLSAGVAAVAMVLILSGALAGLGLWALVRGQRGLPVVLDAAGITVPRRAGSQRAKTIPYATIRGLDLRTQKGGRVLWIDTKDGRTAIAGAALPRGALDEIATRLAGRIGR